MSIWFGRSKAGALTGCFLSFLLATSTQACPGLILAYQLPRGLPPIQRDSLQLLAYEEGSAPWRPIAMQIDPLDEEGSLIFPKDPKWMQQDLGPYDRLSFRVQDFGRKLDPSAPRPCPGAEWIELRSQDKFAYLVHCRKHTYKGDAPVTLDEKERRVSSSQYEYAYTPENHLIFDQIRLQSAEGKLETAAIKGDLLIVSDIKRFFTLVFDSSDIDAKITSKRSGPMGLMGGLQFFLRILAFRIELALEPEVNFFGDSLFMPMMMHLPVDATRYLRRGSGIYYTWETGPETSWLLDKSRLEELSLDALDPSSSTPLGRSSDTYCGAVMCRYRLLGRVKNRLVALHFAINRKAADLGFYPRLIRDVAAVEKTIGRKISRYPASGRIGVYFETARLPEGTHTWDFWIHFPEQENSPCTVPVRAQRLLADKDLAP
jgi:hypothetical protein